MKEVNLTIYPNNECLESHQVCRYLKISDSTLYRYRKTNKIPFIKVGGKYVYPKIYFINMINNALEINKMKNE